MPVPRPVFRRAAALAGLALAAAGCGGSGHTATATTTTLPAPTTSVPPPGEPQLQSIVVQPSDLPAGWTPSRATPPTDRGASNAAFAQCIGIADTDADMVAVAYSQNFSKGPVVINSRAVSYHARADVPVDTAALLDPKAATCLQQVGKSRLAAGLPPGATVKSYTVKVTPGTGGGAANVIATVTSAVVYSAGGKQLTLNDDVVYLVAPRIEARIDFYNVGKPVDVRVKAAVVAKVAQRVAFGS